MDDGFDSVHRGRPGGVDEDPAAVVRRLRRDMCVATALAALLSLALAPWRVTTGLVLGGALALFNLGWLSSSVRAVFGGAQAGRGPRLGAARYVLRYFVVAAVVAAGYGLGLVSLVATLAGMCSFVPAALAEGFRILYFSFSGREDS
ncbi:MAG TPA: ATP synthase subunit I [Pyrinomonadaceae bacterium]|nr:ATP synthase subunit I [Pyrinomonadaceae bacterium]